MNDDINRLLAESLSWDMKVTDAGELESAIILDSSFLTNTLEIVSFWNSEIDEIVYSSKITPGLRDKQNLTTDDIHLLSLISYACDGKSHLNFISNTIVQILNVCCNIIHHPIARDYLQLTNAFVNNGTEIIGLNRKLITFMSVEHPEEWHFCRILYRSAPVKYTLDRNFADLRRFEQIENEKLFIVEVHNHLSTSSFCLDLMALFIECTLGLKSIRDKGILVAELSGISIYLLSQISIIKSRYNEGSLLKTKINSLALEKFQLTRSLLMFHFCTRYIKVHDTFSELQRKKDFLMVGSCLNFSSKTKFWKVIKTLNFTNHIKNTFRNNNLSKFGRETINYLCCYLTPFAHIYPEYLDNLNCSTVSDTYAGKINYDIIDKMKEFYDLATFINFD